MACSSCHPLTLSGPRSRCGGGGGIGGSCLGGGGGGGGGVFSAPAAPSLRPPLQNGGAAPGDLPATRFSSSWGVHRCGCGHRWCAAVLLLVCATKRLKSLRLVAEVKGCARTSAVRRVCLYALRGGRPRIAAEYCGKVSVWYLTSVLGGQDHVFNSLACKAAQKR